MTAEQMHARALSALAEEFSRTHDDPHADALDFMRRLTRSGWRPVPALADLPAQARTAPRHVAEAAIAEIRDELAAVRRRLSDGGA